MRDTKIVLFILLITSTFFAGCAGREANPVPCYIEGDENLSCQALREEITRLQEDMLALLPKTDKSFTNTLWCAGGVVAIAPYFFMDVKDAERIEYEAFRRRHNRLLLIAKEKDCDMSDIKAEPIPSLEQRKIMEKEKKK